MDMPLLFEADCAGAEATIYVRDGAGRVLSLPSRRVHRMSFAVDAAPVPFAPLGYEGVAAVDGIVAAQIDVTVAAGGAAKSGRYSLLARCGRGWVHVRVAGVSLVDPEPGVEHGDALALLERLTSGLTRDGCVVELDPALEDALPPAALPLLVVRTGGRLVALPAREVERVAPHQGSWPIRQGDADERVVAMGGDVLPGCSLAEWMSDSPMDGAADAAEEGWAAVMTANGRRMAITFTALDGLVTAPLTRIRRLAHRRHAARHCIDPERGAIEIVDPRDFAAPAATPTSADEGEDPDAPPSALSAEAEPPSVPDGGLAAMAGPFVCVFSRGAVNRLLTGVGLERVAPQRSAGAFPVFDLAALLGLAPQDGARTGRILLLNRPGRRAVALFVDGVGPTESVPDWQALPAAPQPIPGLFSAMRLVGSRPTLQLLVRDSLLADRVGAGFAAALRPTLLGWLDPRLIDGDG
ncbi:hypothetical protein [Azospirillum sp.]|uniref:hypothetical protein n=1 Tax=Azospirillum sp. TaxID=34012 RepID=UPI00261976F7|nr:hypothetical protein [Azospirillum sp.]